MPTIVLDAVEATWIAVFLRKLTKSGKVVNPERAFRLARARCELDRALFDAEKKAQRTHAWKHGAGGHPAV